MAYQSLFWLGSPFYGRTSKNINFLFFSRNAFPAEQITHIALKYSDLGITLIEIPESVLYDNFARRRGVSAKAEKQKKNSLVR